MVLEPAGKDILSPPSPPSPSFHRASLHVVFSAECIPAFDWQSCGLFYSFHRVKQPGRITRLLACSAEQLKDLEKYMSMDATERETQLTSLKDALKKAEDDHNDLLKNLQEQFKTSQDALEKLKEDSAPTIKMLKAATPSGKAAAGKDEV